MSIEGTVSVVAAGLLGMGLWRLQKRRRTLRAATQRPLPAALLRYPSLTMIRPIRGLDPGAAENIAAALANGYPGEVETLFVFDDEKEPALPLVYAAIAAHQKRDGAGTARVLFAGLPQAGRTGKLNAMACGVDAAQAELIGFADSDIRPDSQALGRLVELLLGSDRCGAVFAPVRVSQPVQTLGDVGYALMLNALYTPAVALLAAEHEALPFIMGQLMIFRRSTLAAIGGIDCARGQLVDDMHLGTRVAAAGYQNLMSSAAVPIIDWGVGLAEFSRTYRRWLAFSRSGLPLRFCIGAAEPYLLFWLGLGGAAVALATGHPWAATLPIGLAATAGLGLLVLNRAAGGAAIPWRWAGGSYLLLLSGPFIYLAQLLWPEVRWRGRTYGLDAQARLSQSPSFFIDLYRRAVAQ